MQVLRQLGGGLFYGLVSALLVIGGLSLALAETMPTTRPTQTSTLPAIPQTLTPTLPGPTQVPSSTPLPTETPLPPTNCPPPSGWIRISVQSGETLDILAARYNTTTGQLIQANCLLTSNLLPGYGLYVPNVPQPVTATFTFIPTIIRCGPFPGWILGYTVQPGDTLFRIAFLYRTGTQDLQRANCLLSTTIFTGQKLWVPNVPTMVPPPTFTPGVTIIPIFNTPTFTPTFSPTETWTFTPAPNTETPTLTPFPDTPTFTSAPPSPTVTAFPTATP